MDNSKSDTEKQKEAQFAEEIGDRAQRKLHHRKQNGRRSIWHGLGAMGTIGWTVGLPTIIGVLLGAWIDSVWETSPISWTLTLLIGGLLFGLVSAWLWMEGQRKEISEGLFKSEEDENDDQ